VPHFPLQAPAEDIARYRDTYLAGWDAIRQQRYERQLRMGLINCALSERETERSALLESDRSATAGTDRSWEVARALAWDELTPVQSASRQPKCRFMRP